MSVDEFSEGEGSEVEGDDVLGSDSDDGEEL